MQDTILAISGKPGLYRLVSQGRGMLIVETIDETKKRLPAGARDRVTSLNDVSMYTLEDDQPLMNIFQNIADHEGGKETALNNANKYRNEQIPEAKAEVDKILQDAEAQKESRINEAEGQVARFNSMYEEYIKYPTITKQRMFYETMEDVMPNMKIIIEGADGSKVQQLLPLEPFSTTTVNGEAAGNE